MARSSFGPSKDGTNFSVPPILVVPNKGLLLLGAVLIAGGFDAVLNGALMASGVCYCWFGTIFEKALFSECAF